MNRQPVPPTGGPEAFDIDEAAQDISWIAHQAALFFDIEGVPMSIDPDEYSATFDGMVMESMECAVAAAGYDVDREDVWTEIHETRQAHERIGAHSDYDFGDHVFSLAAHMDSAVVARRCPRAPRGRRRSRGRPMRRRGSRRTTSRSAGGGSSGDSDEGEPGEARLGTSAPIEGVCTHA